MVRDSITMMVAHNLEAIMASRGINAAELARRAKLNPTGIYDILKGKSRSPKVETLAKIAEALNVPISILFEDRADDALRHELAVLFERLPEADRQRLLDAARAWAKPTEGA